MIDTHCHVIPYCDDGAEDWDMALQMLQNAADDGIEQIVCTPHVLSSSDLLKEEKFLKLYDELVKKAADADIPIQLHMGSELYIQPDFDFTKTISTLAENGVYFLIEFPMSNIPTIVAKKFFDTLPSGKIPVIAHPERNGSVIKNPEMVLDFIEKGAIMQVTAGSLLGRFGNQVQQVAKKLMEANAVHIIASDAHDTTSRTLTLRKAYTVVLAEWGPEKANLLFKTNPEKIINGQLIERLDVEPNVFQTKKKSLFRFFK